MTGLAEQIQQRFQEVEQGRKEIHNIQAALEQQRRRNDNVRAQQLSARCASLTAWRTTHGLELEVHRQRQALVSTQSERERQTLRQQSAHAQAEALRQAFDDELAVMAEHECYRALYTGLVQSMIDQTRTQRDKRQAKFQRLAQATEDMASASAWADDQRVYVQEVAQRMVDNETSENEKISTLAQQVREQVAKVGWIFEHGCRPLTHFDSALPFETSSEPRRQCIALLRIMLFCWSKSTMGTLSREPGYCKN